MNTRINCYLPNFISSVQSPLSLDELVNLTAEPNHYYLFIKNKNSCYEYANQPFVELMSLKQQKELLGQSDSLLCADKEQVKRYWDDDCFVLESLQSRPVLDKVAPRYNSPLVKTMKGTLYPLTINANHPNYVLGIVTPLTKLIKLDWDTLFSLNYDELAELLVKKRYPLVIHGVTIYFSKREIQVLVELLRGSHTGQIAEHLCLKQSTVESYLVNIKNKLGVSTKAELIAIVISSRFLQQILL